MPSLENLEQDLKSFIGRNDRATAETKSRLLAMEQHITAPRGNGGGGYEDDLGSRVTCSEEFKRFQTTPNLRTSGKISVGSLQTKTNLVSYGGLGQPLVPPYIMPGIIRPGQQPLTVRDLLPSTPISSNLVEYSKEVSSTNNAAMQTAESALKAESALGFSLLYAPVQTLAHWIPVSKQLLDDAPAIQGYVNSRMLFFLKLAEDRQILNGDGTGTNLSGLITNATAYDTTQTNVATDTFIDVIQHAITQVSKSFLRPDGVVLNPLDFARIQLIKTTGTASSGQYIYANPHEATSPTLWGLPVALSWSLSESQFLVGAFAMAAMIWDRNNATIEISREHADFFVRNMAAILVEERLALTVFRDDALVFGGFPFGS